MLVRALPESLLSDTDEVGPALQSDAFRDVFVGLLAHLAVNLHVVLFGGRRFLFLALREERLLSVLHGFTELAQMLFFLFFLESQVFFQLLQLHLGLLLFLYHQLRLVSELLELILQLPCNFLELKIGVRVLLRLIGIGVVP